MPDFIPQNAAAFLKFAQGVVSYTSFRMGILIIKPFEAGMDDKVESQSETRRPGSEEIWTHIPETAYYELSGRVAEFEREFNNTTIDSPRSQIVRRNEAQRQCESVLRYFVRFYLRNPVVTNAELTAMGIPPIDNIRTVHKQVNETVDFVFHIRGTNNVIVDFWQTGHASKAKPRGYSGAVVIWALSEEEPENNEAYPFHTLATRTPYTIEFDNHDSGKRVWVKICWQNARGILGRFSEAKSAIVP